MRIGIDGNEANIGYKVGVHQYAYELLWSFHKLNNTKTDKHQFVIYLKQPPASDLPPANDWWTYKVLKSKGLWILTRLTPHLIFNRNVDVFFSPSHYLPLLSNVPKVLTIHDLGYLEFTGQFNKKDYYQLKYWTAKSLFDAKYVIAVSESTKKDILKHYRIKGNKIKVVLHGYDQKRFSTKTRISNNESVLNKYKIKGKYLLYLGTLKPSKNIEGLINAYYRMDKKYKEKYYLVIAGKKGWMYKDIYELVRSLKLEDRVVFTGYIDEQDKEVIYKNAKILVQPSFWEGFGMQVLDAMAMGTPVVISDIASLPEVGGDAAVYVNPQNIDNIKEGMEKVLTMSEVEYNNIVQKGLKQVENFSWEKSGKETLKVLESAEDENRK